MTTSSAAAALTSRVIAATVADQPANVRETIPRMAFYVGRGDTPLQTGTALWGMLLSLNPNLGPDLDAIVGARTYLQDLIAAAVYSAAEVEGIGFEGIIAAEDVFEDDEDAGDVRAWLKSVPYAQIMSLVFLTAVEV